MDLKTVTVMPRLMYQFETYHLVVIDPLRVLKAFSKVKGRGEVLPFLSFQDGAKLTLLFPCNS